MYSNPAAVDFLMIFRAGADPQIHRSKLVVNQGSVRPYLAILMFGAFVRHRDWLPDLGAPISMGSFFAKN